MTFYSEVRIYRPDEHYWTIGLRCDAADFNQASALFMAWCAGFGAVSGAYARIQEITASRPRGRTYLSFADPAIATELYPFLLGETK